MTLVAGIDSSTQSCKLEVRDADTGGLVRSEQRPHSPTTPPRSSLASLSPPRPSVPAANARQIDRSRQAAAARKGRTAGSTGRMTMIAPAASSATGTSTWTCPTTSLSPSTSAVPAVPPSQPR